MKLQRVIGSAMLALVVSACDFGGYQSGNLAPSVSYVGAKTFEEGEAVTVSILAEDPEGGDLSIKWSQLPGGIDLDVAEIDRKTLEFLVPELEADQTVSFEVEVSDDAGNTTQQQVVFSLLNVPKSHISGKLLGTGSAPAEVVVKTLSGTELARVGTEAEAYSVTLRSDEIEGCVILEVATNYRDEIEGEQLVALICPEAGSTSSNANISPLSTAIALRAELEQSEQLKDRVQNERALLARFGIDPDGEGGTTWDAASLLIGAHERGIEGWLTTFSDQLDLESIDFENQRALFPQSHGGVAKFDYPLLQLFPGLTQQSFPSVVETEVGAFASANLTAVNEPVPAWVQLDQDGTIKADPPVGTAPGTYSYLVAASADGVQLPRKARVSIEVVAPVVLVEGSADENGANLRNEFQDIELVIPVGILEEVHNFQYVASLTEAGDLVTTLFVDPPISQAQRFSLSLQEPFPEQIVSNYVAPALNQSSELQQKSTGNNCTGSSDDCWQDRNRDGFSFGHSWTSGRADFLSREKREGIVFVHANTVDEIENGLDGGDPRVLVNISPKGSQISKARSFALRSSLSPQEYEASHSHKIPVLLIHGFIPNGELGGFNYSASNEQDRHGEYFGVLPKLIADFDDGSRYVPFLFQWRTNAPFQLAAHELGIALEKIREITGKKAHVIAHSYGGLLARTLIQGEASPGFSAQSLANGGEFAMSDYDTAFALDHVRSLTTIGTPHSGIFTGSASVTFDSVTLDFERGVDGPFGSATRLCEAVTCHQAGGKVDALHDQRACVRETPQSALALPHCSDGRDLLFGMLDRKGHLVHKLRAKLDSEGWPEIPTQALIGLIGDIQNNTDIQGTVTHFVQNANGDKLISKFGQRFDAASNSTAGQLNASSDAREYIGAEYLQERMLGFNVVAESFIDFPQLRSATDYLFQDLEIHRLTPIKEPVGGQFSSLAVLRGYNHRTSSQGAGLWALGVEDWKRSRLLYPGETYSASEVGIQECINSSPDSCVHASWQYIKSHMVSLDVAASPEEAIQTIDLFGQVLGLDGALDSVELVFRRGDDVIESTNLDFASDGQFVANVRFVADANYSVTVISPESSGLRSETAYVTAGASLEATLMNVGVIDLTPIAFADGTANLQVVDSISGAEISDFILSIANDQESIGQSDNNPLENGIQLPPGRFIFTVEAPGYVPKERLCIVRPSSVSLCRLELVREISSEERGKLTTTLSWSENPSDLDSHLVKYGDSRVEEYHVFFGNRQDANSGDSLDRDDVSGIGPETITIRDVDPNAIYMYYVHHYSGEGSITSNSQARVDVTNNYHVGSPFQDSYPAPTQGEGRYWKVFEVKNGIVEPCQNNCMFGGQPTLKNRSAGRAKQGQERVPAELEASVFE